MLTAGKVGLSLLFNDEHVLKKEKKKKKSPLGQLSVWSVSDFIFLALAY